MPHYLLRTVSCCLLGGALLTSCEESIDLSVAGTADRLVIQSRFLAGEDVEVSVFGTQGGLQGTPTVVTDALVMLYEGDELVDQLSADATAPGTYRSQVAIPEPGRTYALHVSAAGYDPVTAQSSLPLPVQLTDLTLLDLTVSGQAGTVQYAYVLDVDYADPRGQVDYYDLRIYQQVVPYTITARGDTIRQPAYLKSADAPDRPAQASEALSVLVQDRPEDRPVRLHLQSTVAEDREQLMGLVVELRTVSSEYYRYQRSVGSKLSSPLDGLYEPVILYDNVASGLGIFAGYTSELRTIPFHPSR